MNATLSPVTITRLEKASVDNGFDQELPREGTTARRRCYLLRGFVGEPLLWTGRELLTGGQYGSIPLTFDQILGS